MIFVVSLLSLLILTGRHEATASSLQETIAAPNLSINSVPFSTRVYWMRRTITALLELGSPCPLSAFASVIVNHTVPGLGTLVCIGANSKRQTGDPTLYGAYTLGVRIEVQLILMTSSGEIAAIRNCSAILTDPTGPYKLSPTGALDAFAQLSLYTNAESCPMVRSIRSFCLMESE
jgi:hypothetical protein